MSTIQLDNNQYEVNNDTTTFYIDNCNTYRGKFLGTSVTAEQLANIQNGTFKGLYIGDYWTINNYDWLIADMNYWLNTGDITFSKNHLVIVPRTSYLYTAEMNEDNTTEGGYTGSEMYKTGLDRAKEIINTAFDGIVLSHREILINRVVDGKPYAGAWVDSTVELMNECMVYGHPHYTPTSDGTTVPYLFTIDKTQLTLFRLRSEFIFNRSASYWLRDVVSTTYFAFITADGGANAYGASGTRGVRPVFAIG